MNFFLCLLLGGWQQALAQTCTSQAGTIQPGTYQTCPNVPFTIPYNNDAVLDADDAVFFVLHDGTATSLGTILHVSTSPVINNIWVGNLVLPTYQVACVVTNNTWGTWPDFNDPCASISGGAAITFLPVPSVGIISPDILNCGNTEVTLTANAFPLGVAYQYQWDGPVSNPSIKSPTTSTAGDYTVTVTNSFCTTTASATVYTPETVPVQVDHGNFVCNGTNTQTITVYALQQNIPITYQWNTGDMDNQIIVPTNSSDNYCVTISFNSNCTRVICDTAWANIPDLTMEYSYNGCTDSLNGLFPRTAYLGWPLDFFWSNGSTDGLIENPASGLYSVTVTNTGGCSQIASYLVENEGDNCATLRGNVFGDLNSDCAADAGDINLANRIILIKDASGAIVRYNYTDENGYWETEIEAGDYQISVIPPSTIWEPCGNNIPVTVAPEGTATQDLFLKPLDLCPSLSVDMNDGILRRCLPTGHYINYCNEGTAPAENAYLEVMLDPMLVVDSAQLAYTPILGAINMFRFELGTVAVGECGYFWIATHVSCDAAVNTTLCSKVTAFPNDPCGPQSGWSGASLAITGTCDQDSVTFVLKNVGTASMSNELEYVVIEDAIMMLSAPPPSITLGPGLGHTVRVPANGSTWRVQAEQEPNHPGNSAPAVTIEGCTTGQTYSVGYVNQYPLDDADTWIDEDCSVVVGSYDPNFKEGFPNGYGAEHEIDRSTELEYVIHFQNVGNDTAFTVVIRDTIASWLDVTSIRPGASSHSYTFDFYGTGSNVKFTFDDINLPDSSKTELGSQGFVSYRIRQKPGVPFGTDVRNTAAIYFDFNEPIITNTTIHQVDTNFVLVSVWTPVSPELTLQVAPNPTKDVALLAISGLNNATEVKVELIDQLGRICQSNMSTNHTVRVERGQLAAGMYTIRVTSESGLLGIGKVIFE